MALKHQDIKGRLTGVTPLGALGHKASGLADMMADFAGGVTEVAVNAVTPKNNISSIVQDSPSPTGMA